MVGETVLPEYYQLVWFFIHQNHDELLRQRNIIEPRRFRQNLVLKHFQACDTSDTHSQYENLRIVQDKIEGELREVVAQKSAFFWLHIYRRIAPVLSSEIGNRTDEITRLETRAIAEQAIFKYGKLVESKDVVLSNSIKFELILGGLLIKILNSMLGSEAVNLYKSYLSRKPQWVLSDFSENDIATIYYIEGLSYQYWYVSAKLRACGKGVNIRKTTNGDLFELRTDEQDDLIISYDNRCKNNDFNHGFASNVGTFVCPGAIKEADTIFFVCRMFDKLALENLI